MREKFFPISEPIPGALQRQAMNAVAAIYVLKQPKPEDKQALETLCERISTATRQLAVDGGDNAFGDDDIFFQCVGLVSRCSLAHEDIAVGDNGKPDFRYQVIMWMNKWEERITGWVRQPELETQPRMFDIMTFLNQWSSDELLQHTGSERGCPVWLLKHDLWDTNKSAGFNPELQRHVLHRET